MKDDVSAQAKPSRSKRYRDDNNELQAASKKKQKNSAHKYEAIDLEEMLAETFHKDKETEIYTPPVDNAKQSPAEGSEFRRSKRIKGRLPNKIAISVKKWSDNQEMCLANALLDTRTPEGEVNKAAFYQRAKERLRLEVSDYHLYEKMRRMRRKFWSMVKDKTEDKLVFRTTHEQVLFLLLEKIWGNLVAENPNPSEFEAENPNPYDFEAENPNPNVIDVENYNSNGIEAETLNPALNPNPLNNEATNPKPDENDAGNPKSSENHNSKENDAGKSKSGENLNPIENEPEQSLPQETHVKNTRENGHFIEKFVCQEIHLENARESRHSVEKSPCQEIHEKNSREIGHFLEKLPHQKIPLQNAGGKNHFATKSLLQETHVEYARENDHFVDNLGLGLTQREIRGLESRIEAAFESLVRSMELKLEAAVESSVRSMELKFEAAIQSWVSFVVSAAGAANCQSSRRFGGEVGMGSGALASVTRTMKELMHGVDSVEELPGLDTGEARQLQQQWRKIKIQELKTFSEGLELLNTQCKLFLKIAETSNERNGS